jgi:hypothetical protein
VIELNGTKIGAFPSHHLNDDMCVGCLMMRNTHIDAVLVVVVVLMKIYLLFLFLFLGYLAKSRASRLKYCYDGTELAKIF